jgi:hypothetical protein
MMDIKNFLQDNAAETNKHKEERRKKPKPEEQEGMPQHQHCPHAKRRGDLNPKCHEEQQKDTLMVVYAHGYRSPHDIPIQSCLNVLRVCFLASVVKSTIG